MACDSLAARARRMVVDAGVAGSVTAAVEPCEWSFSRMTGEAVPTGVD